MNGTCLHTCVCAGVCCMSIKTSERLCVCASLPSGCCLCGLRARKEGVVRSMQAGQADAL